MLKFPRLSGALEEIEGRVLLDAVEAPLTWSLSCNTVNHSLNGDLSIAYTRQLPPRVLAYNISPLVTTVGHCGGKRLTVVALVTLPPET